jgi:4-diphosphocytidyl-2-C-methyl-D-erythritol kinase
VTSPDIAAPAVQVRAPAKLNLHLGVGPRRADGFHELLTIFHAVSLYDTLSIAPAATPTLRITGEGAASLATDRTNLAWRAVDLVAAEYGRPPEVAMSLHKRIPVAAGLAGGSADAAAALVGADALWGGRLSAECLRSMAADLGSDVAFALTGATAEGTGRGERLRPVPVGARLHWVLAVSTGELSTPEVYARFDELTPQPALAEPVALLAALRAGDVASIAAALDNDLQPAALLLAPELAGTLAAGRRLGAYGGVVSGSGPTCAFLAGTAADADRLARALVDEGRCRRAHVVAGPVPGAASNRSVEH